MSKGIRKYPYYKYSDVNASFIRKFYRHCGGFIATKLLKTKITPNSITVISSLLLVLASFTILVQTRAALFVAAALAFLSLVLDKTDGSLARMRGTGSSFGVWLDSISDNVTIMLFLGALAVRAFVETGQQVYLFAGLFTLLSFQTIKFTYLRFQKTFVEANNIIAQGKGKIRGLFNFNEYFVMNWGVVVLLINQVQFYVLFSAVYGWAYYLAMVSLFTLKGTKLSRKLTAEEELTSK